MWDQLNYSPSLLVYGLAWLACLSGLLSLVWLLWLTGRVTTKDELSGSKHNMRAPHGEHFKVTRS